MTIQAPKILWDNRLSDATPVASSTAAGDYNVLNLRDWRPYTWWKPAVGNAYVTVDCGVPRKADYALIYGHDLDTAHNHLEVYGSTDNFVTSFVKLAGSNCINYNENMEHAVWYKPNVTQGADFRWSKLTLQEWHATAAGFNAVAYGPGKTYFANSVASLFVKKSTSSYVTLNMYDDGAGVTHALEVGFDGNGVPSAGFNVGLDGYGIIDEGDGVYRIWLYVDAATRGLLDHQFSFYVYPNPTNTGTSGTYIGGGQVNSGTTPAAYQSTSGDNNRPLYLPFTASAEYRYWRFKLNEMSGSIIPSLAIASVGEALNFERALPYGFDPSGRKAVSTRNRSVAGWPLGSVVEYQEWSETVSARHASQSWLRQKFIPAWDTHLASEPFVFIWEPGDHADEIYLTSMAGEFKAPHTPLSRCDLSFNIVGVA